MTREEAERVAARLVTVNLSTSSNELDVLVSGHRVHIGWSMKRAEELAARERAAIVRMLVESVEAGRQAEATREAWEESQAQLADAKAKLAAVSAGREDVWFWQGDGQDHAESLTCPVVMQASTMRRFELAAEVCELMLQKSQAAAWSKLLEWKKGAVDGR